MILCPNCKAQMFEDSICGNCGHIEKSRLCSCGFCDDASEQVSDDDSELEVG